MIIKKHHRIKQNKPINEPEIEQEIQPAQTEEIVEEPKSETPIEEDPKDIFAGFNFDEIDFNQRAERRRGDRRRGYRRIDDRNLVSRAQQEAISIKEQATKEGYEKGITIAQDALSELKTNIEEFLDYKNTMYDKISDDILDIAIKVAEKIIKKEVETDKSVLSCIVKDALKSLAKGENKIILKVNPTDVEYAKEVVPTLLPSSQAEAKILVTGDKEVEEGSAVIETSNGIIDANISTQLEIIKEAFKQI